MLESSFVLLFVLNPLTILAAVLLTKGVVMSDVQAVVDAITAQLGKVREEVVGEIAKLEAALQAGVTPDLAGLKAAADALDAIVPDAEEVVEDEVPVEEV